jgi:FKBP-type peptidyl-prolyl cis-trans isomerase SlyD
MPKEIVKNGKFVALTYTISDSDNNLLEHNAIPVNYIHGGSHVLIGNMDKKIAGKSVGDEVEMTLSPEDGFGPHYPELTFTDELENVPPEFRQVGAEVQMTSDSGEVQTFYVTNIEDGKLTVDGNHPMAGKTLTVRITIQEVRDPTPDEQHPLSDSGAVN